MGRYRSKLGSPGGGGCLQCIHTTEPDCSGHNKIKEDRQITGDAPTSLRSAVPWKDPR